MKEEPSTVDTMGQRFEPIVAGLMPYRPARAMDRRRTSRLIEAAVARRIIVGAVAELASFGVSLKLIVSRLRALAEECTHRIGIDFANERGDILRRALALVEQ